MRIFFKAVFNQKPPGSFARTVTLCLLVSAVELLGGCSLDKECNGQVILAADLEDFQ